MLHDKTSEATAAVLQASDKEGPRAAPIGGESRSPNREPDKLTLMKRVIELESQLLRKQRHAQQKSK